jgi:hypothetical protein
LVEGYPDLRASDVFGDLQRRYTDAEDAVAAARQFYNDAIELLRNRRSQFPGNLFARLVSVPSWKLFEAEEAATIAPPVALAPEAAPNLDPLPSAPPSGPPASPPSLPPPPGGTSF